LTFKRLLFNFVIVITNPSKLHFLIIYFSSEHVIVGNQASMAKASEGSVTCVTEFNTGGLQNHAFLKV